MSFSINTNVASLQAQNYLRINQNFQNQTINEVTSGLKIVNSGDDAAGLAIANGYRSEEAVLTQGINNANDGLSQLQIADGGLNNISQLLDRASTLATQSASGTFTGNRTILNNEFQSVLAEINREAQSIGLNQGGTFAKSLSVFVGGGAGSTTASQTTNGSVGLDLSHSTVDSQSLGLNGFVAGYQVASGAQDSGLYDLGASSATSVAAIVAASPLITTTQFQVSGPGFSDASAITLNVGLTNVGDTPGLVSAINASIQGAESSGSAAGQALKDSNLVAQIHTGADGHQQLQFSSTSTAFQVTALDATSNGLLGNLGTNTAGAFLNSTATPEAATLAAASFVSGGTQQYSAAYTPLVLGASPANDTQTLTFTALDANGVPQTAKVTIAGGLAANLSGAGAVAAINTALQATDNPALQTIVASTDPTGGTITFTSGSNSKFTLSIGLEAGTSAGTTGLAGPNTVHSSALVGTGASSSVADQASAEAAVTALASAVTTLGSAQAVVGRGENQFNYAINLAQSQHTNLATAESNIRDADLAAEAANLTKAQILLQAGVAALAQANSAPQNVLSLLKA